MRNQSEILTYKFHLIGNAGSGKSSIISRYMNGLDKFENNYDPFFYSKKIVINNTEITTMIIENDYLQEKGKHARTSA